MAKIAPYFAAQELDNNGNPLAGGKIYSNEAGTSTPKDTFTTADGSTANANPIILDSSGRADIWLGSGAYKFVIKDSADVEIKSIDNIVGEASNVFGSTVLDISTNTVMTTANENNYLNCTAILTISLLPTTTAEEGFVFIVKNSSLDLVTLDPDGSETINGASTLILNPQGWAIVICDGTNWRTLANNKQKDKIDATVAPTVSNDDTEGYSAGSRWLDVTGNEAYLCFDASTGAADWRNTTLEIADLGSSATKDFIDDDTMATASAITTASSESIVAYVASQANVITLATPQVTTSGTAFDFTGIPAGTKKISVMIYGVSLSGTDNILIQLGDAGGFETSGYISLAGTSTNVTSYTTGFGTSGMSAATGANGVLNLELVDASTFSWVASGTLITGTTRINLMTGIKDLSAELTQVRVTRTGANTFDAGKVNISYQS